MTSIQNSTSGTFSFENGVQLTGCQFINCYIGNAAATTTDIYTVPAGKKAIALGVCYYNYSVSTVVIYPNIKIGANYYRLPGGVSLTASNQSTQNTVWPVLEAGHTVAITADGTGANAWIRIVEFDANNAPKSSYIEAPSSGDNTLYTVPAGKTAMSYQTVRASDGAVVLSNSSGGAINMTAHAVPSGGSKGNDNQLRSAVAVNDATANTIALPYCLNAGDSVVVNLDAAGTSSLLYFTYIEI